MMRRLVIGAGLLAGAFLSGATHTAPAQTVPVRGDSAATVLLDTLPISGRIDDLVGIAGTSSQGFVGMADLRARPITREGELLETVPGVIVTQHSGEGKANQYFVRGFNLDHGTDFQTRIEGIPLNLPTHGHGQGWTDLNPLIPEFVDHLDYRLGVYHAELGDFGSAGGAEFHLVRSLERPFASVGLGQNGYARLVGGASTDVARGDLLVGGEARTYDGPWELDQDLRKLSGLARYSRSQGPTRFSVLGMAYRNRWRSTDQVPLRAVEGGLIDRLGYIDPTDGGTSARYSLSGEWTRIGSRSIQVIQLFGVYSDLELFSNFTYFLEDSDQGDQFRQKDRRVILGGNARHAQETWALGVPHSIRLGVQSRADLVGEIGLARTRERVHLSTIREDRVSETATGVFVEAVSRWRPWFRTVLGLRADGYTFHVDSDRPENSGDRRAGIVSPKASLVFTPSRALELYASGGYGFHSNDARGTTITVDPVTGEPAERVDPLVRSRGGEVGLRAAPVRGFRSTLTAWALELASELLFVGDAGSTEPSGRSRRSGLTWANFYTPIPHLSLDADLSIARARLTSAPEGEGSIPGALEQVFAGGVAWTPPQGFSGSVRVRHFGAYPLIEDNSVRAGAASLLNAEAGYRLASGLRIEAALLNVLDARASDIEYFYASRLRGEPAEGVADVHFHPVEPRQLRLTLSWGL